MGALWFSGTSGKTLEQGRLFPRRSFRFSKKGRGGSSRGIGTNQGPRIMSTKTKILAIAGGSGSGKSTLAQLIKAALPKDYVEIIAVDDYYLKQDNVPLVERAKMNYDHPSALEFELLAHHLSELKQGRAVFIPTYDFSQHTRSNKTRKLEPPVLLIVEGILSLHHAHLRSFFDYSIFVETPDQLRFSRRLTRDTKERGRTEQSVHQQWAESVQPMYLSFCRPSAQFANEILGANQCGLEIYRPVIDRLLSRFGPSKE
jgi:uridine kinase